MAKQWFENRKLTGQMKVACRFDDGTVRYWEAKKEDIAAKIIYIVREYMKIGERLTLRQLHYQLVSRNWTVNHDTAYKKLGSILDDLRYSGMIDWDAIEDRGRVPRLDYYVDGMADALNDTIRHYKLDRQRGRSKSTTCRRTLRR